MPEINVGDYKEEYIQYIYENKGLKKIFDYLLKRIKNLENIIQRMLEEGNYEELQQEVGIDLE